MRLSRRVAFRSQHRTPIVPQIPHDAAVPLPVPVSVGYLLHRQPVVKHTPHPLETEMAHLLEREHQRYCRHDATESATHFMSQRGLSIDVLNRTDPRQIQGNFFGLELYQDAMRVVLQRYKPERRVTPQDLCDPSALSAAAPPPRHSIHRKLDDYLYLLVQDEEGRWTVPHTKLGERETLRMAADRAVAQHNGEALDCYFWSNAPQATVLMDESTKARLFVYTATYLTGRPKFSNFEPKLKDHAWVTRHEMMQYKNDFYSNELLNALLDVSADGMFES